jgi:hypothetical protein
MDALAKETEKEERKINSSIRNLVGDSSITNTVVDTDDTAISIKNLEDLMD